MKIYHAVTQKFYDNGRVFAGIHTVPLKQKPEAVNKNTNSYDMYIDYFDTQKEAESWKKQALNS